MRRALPALSLLTMLASGCASLPPAIGPTAVAGMPVPPSLEAEVEALARVETYDDPLLNEYLAGIADRLASEDEREAGVAPPAITVLRDPTIAAFTLPDGRVYLHTGLLSRVANEAQLAAVVAREITHLRRRAVATATSPSAITEAIAALAPSMIDASRPGVEAGQPLSPTAAVILGKGLTVAYAAALAGRGEVAEREADDGALERVVRAAYDPQEAPRVFERLRRDARAGGPSERFFLTAEAGAKTRVERMTNLVASSYAVAAGLPDTVRDTAEFDAVLGPLVRENARLELRAGRLRFAQEQLDRALSAMPADPLAHLYAGDLHRVRGQRARSVADRDELARAALASYERSEALDPGIAEVPRRIGLLYYQQGRYDLARGAFERYLAQNPTAPDAARVAEYVQILTR
jgi:tetratricopeptide (TPR) repeat protein